MSTGNAVVDRAIEAHGGEARWRRVQTIATKWTFRGTMFKLRLRENELRGLSARVSTKTQTVEVSPFAKKERGHFTPQRVELQEGGVLQALDAPRATFRNPRTVVWWNDLEALYFSGYVLWNYLQLPFLLLWPGLTFETLGQTTHAGERWDKVGVTFPEDVATHSRRQTFFFGPDGLLKRHDYSVEIMSTLAHGARFIRATQTVNGLVLPSRIDIKFGLWGEAFMPFPSLGLVDFDDTTLEEER